MYAGYKLSIVRSIVQSQQTASVCMRVSLFLFIEIEVLSLLVLPQHIYYIHTDKKHLQSINNMGQLGRKLLHNLVFLYISWTQDNWGSFSVIFKNIWK